MNLSEFKTQAAQVHAQLRDAARDMAKAFESARGWTMPDNVEGAILSTLKTIDASIMKLGPDGSITLRVLAGEKSAAWWEEQAAVPRESLAYVGRTMGASLPSWQRIKGEIVDPTAREFVAEATALTEAASSVIPLWLKVAIGGGVAVALFAVVAVYIPKGG